MSGYCYIIQHKYNHDLKKYYGSTLDLKDREISHKTTCHNPNNKRYNTQVYQYIRDNDGWDNWEMIEIYEGVDYEIKEKEFIKSMWEKNTNSYIPLQTDEELKEYQKKYNQEYYRRNKDIIKEYYQVNKEIIREKQSEKIPCEKCGCMISRSNIRAHKKTKKCMEFVSRK